MTEEPKSKTTTQRSQVCCWDLTLFAEKEQVEDVLKYLRKHSKKYCCQGEECPTTGKFHFQIRMSLAKKCRKPPFYDFCKGHASPTNTLASSGDAFYDYCSKDYSRVLGPWKDSDDAPIYIPRQIREIKELYPFQKQIIELGKNWDTRHINWLYCPTGNIGKSILCGYIRAHKLGRVLPMINDYKDLMEIVMGTPTSSFYLLDMPRAIRKDKLYQLISGLETIKDGYCFDTRYSFKEKVFDCPNIWVFSNKLPDKSLLSNDRWIIWTVKDRELITYQEKDIFSDLDTDTD